MEETRDGHDEQEISGNLRFEWNIEINRKILPATLGQG
jgi:hypothetical protein